jgi:hypothetical protein
MRNRNSARRFLLAVALAALGIGSAVPAQAVPIAEGVTVSLSGTTHAARPELGGSVIVDQLIPVAINLGSTGRFSGWLQNRVVRETAGNLTFYYRLHSDSTSTLTPNAVADYLTLPASRLADVDYRIDGLGVVPPTTADRDPGRLVFRFATPVGPGQESRFFFVRTDATDYALNTETIISGESGQVAYMRSLPTWGPVYPAGKPSQKKK